MRTTLTKLGVLTSTMLLSMALLTSCSSNDPEPQLQITPSTNNNNTTNNNTVPELNTNVGLTTPNETEGDPVGDATEEEGEPVEGEDSEEDDDASPADAATLSTTAINFSNVGSSEKLSVHNGTDVKDISYSSSDESVATVAADGTVTAVGDGTATITVKFTSESQSQSLSATVTCSIITETVPEAEPEHDATSEATLEADAPEEEEAPPEEAPPEEIPEVTSVDLLKFYQSMNLDGMQQLSGGYLDQLFAGLNGISTNQSYVYMPMMSAGGSEFGLVEVSNASDVDKVKSIFQTRISNQIAESQNYLPVLEIWQNHAKVVSNGNYVFFVVHENSASMVSNFNNLF